MRLLIISPHFPPANAADMHRVRLLLPYWRENGIEVEVLAVHAEQTNCTVDPWLAEDLPPGLKVHRVEALSRKWGRIPGLGGLAFRAHAALKRAGDLLLQSGEFDLIYFSTTVFLIHSLGPRWKRKFGVPFVMDYQDPWVSDYYRNHPKIVPPGGRFKYGVVDWINRRTEPKVLKACSGITAVSAAYPQQLRARYPWLQNLPELIQPFPGDERDLTRAASSGVRGADGQLESGMVHWVYVGRGGPDMAKSLRSLFLALSQWLPGADELAAKLRLHFIGTSYAVAGSGSKSVAPLATEFGLDSIVSEHTDRLPYSQTLRLLAEADALIVPGSDDPSYTASKIYPYLLAGKPLLTIFHEQSSVVKLIHLVSGAVSVTFTEEDSVADIADRITLKWLSEVQFEKVLLLDKAAFAPYTARSSAKVLSQFLRQCLDTSKHQDPRHEL